MRMLDYILIAVLFLGITSCRHKDLCYDHSHIREIDVVFDWSGVSDDAVPATMALYLYPIDGGKLQRFEFADPHGGRIRLEGGYYNAVCVNSDVRDVDVLNFREYSELLVNSKSMYNLAGLSGVSTKSIPRVKGTEEERVVLPPEIIWTTIAEDADLRLSGSVLEMKPQKRVRKVFVEINNAENLRWINGVSATLSTMSGGYLPTQEALSEENVTIGFNCTYSIEEERITGALSTFGHCPIGNCKHSLTLYVILADNSKWYYNFDVTDQLQKSEGDEDIFIILDKLPIPEPVTESGGLQPQVGEWKEITFDIKM